MAYRRPLKETFLPTTNPVVPTTGAPKLFLEVTQGKGPEDDWEWEHSAWEHCAQRHDVNHMKSLLLCAHYVHSGNFAFCSKGASSVEGFLVSRTAKLTGNNVPWQKIVFCLVSSASEILLQEQATTKQQNRCYKTIWYLQRNALHRTRTFMISRYLMHCLIPLSQVPQFP